MAAKLPFLVVFGIEEHCDLLSHEECVLHYRQEWLIAVTDLIGAIARRKVAAEELKKARGRRHYWTMHSQLWRGFLKVRRAAFASARQKRAKQMQDARWYENKFVIISV